MWLLSTDRAELHFFSSLEKAKCSGYAILSHVWDDVEQSFQDTEALRRAGKAEDGYNPRDHSSAKVRESCILAERHGYKWIWNDASCIDKTSSAELSEAINSMFSYYAHSEMCYAFLADVPESGAFDVPSKRDHTPSRFARSRWFKRGWTLQELIAPAQVIFVSSSWSILGDKAIHAALLSAATSIPRTILTFEEEIWDVSIADRMSWASGRKTTRKEDEAYSLMGIFDIHMPTVYGEGKNAFRRLQEELMRKGIDATLFAWGESPSDHLPRGKLEPFNDRRHSSPHHMFLFATSPSDFSPWARYAPRMVQTPAKIPFSPVRRAIMSLVRTPPSRSGIPSFEITPYGVRARMRVFKFHGFDIADLHISSMHPTITEGDPVGLLLTRSLVGAPGGSTDLLYHPCVLTVSGFTTKLVNIGEIIRRLPRSADRRLLKRSFDGAPWLEFYLAHVPPKPLLAIERNIMNRGATNHFHVPAWLLAQLQAAHLYPSILSVKSQSPRNGGWVTLAIYRSSSRNKVVMSTITFGRCTRETGKLWVDVRLHIEVDIEVPLLRSPENCSDAHHFDAGLPVYTREYKESCNGYTLKVTPVFRAMPHPLSPIHTYVLTELKWIEQRESDAGRRPQNLITVSVSPRA